MTIASLARAYYWSYSSLVFSPSTLAFCFSFAWVVLIFLTALAKFSDFQISVVESGLLPERLSCRCQQTV